MTALDLDAIKARAAAATSGPWHSMPDVVSDQPNWILGRTADPEDGYYGTIDVLRIADGNLDGSYMSDEDAEFIAAAREDVPALVAEVERLRSYPHQVTYDVLVRMGMEREDRGRILDALADALRPDGWATGDFDRESSGSPAVEREL